MVESHAINRRQATIVIVSLADVWELNHKAPSLECSAVHDLPVVNAVRTILEQFDHRVSMIPLVVRVVIRREEAGATKGPRAELLAVQSPLPVVARAMVMGDQGRASRSQERQPGRVDAASFAKLVTVKRVQLAELDDSLILDPIAADLAQAEQLGKLQAGQVGQGGGFLDDVPPQPEIVVTLSEHESSPWQLRADPLEELLPAIQFVDQGFFARLPEKRRDGEHVHHVTIEQDSDRPFRFRFTDRAEDGIAIVHGHMRVAEHEPPTGRVDLEMNQRLRDRGREGRSARFRRREWQLVIDRDWSGFGFLLGRLIALHSLPSCIT